MIKIIERFPLNENFKAIIDYCFRILVFLFFCRHFIYEFVDVVFFPILEKFVNSLNLDPFVDIGVFVICGILTHDYLYAKICGLFKKLDNLNIFTSIFIIIIIDILRGYFWAINIQLTPLKFSYHSPKFFFTLIFAFILYKFFNFITKIFPVPFKKIGYIFSIELIKDIYKDVKKDIQNNYMKK